MDLRPAPELPTWKDYKSAPSIIVIVLPPKLIAVAVGETKLEFYCNPELRPVHSAPPAPPNIAFPPVGRKRKNKIKTGLRIMVQKNKPTHSVLSQVLHEPASASASTSVSAITANGLLARGQEQSNAVCPAINIIGRWRKLKRQ